MQYAVLLRIFFTGLVVHISNTASASKVPCSILGILSAQHVALLKPVIAVVSQKATVEMPINGWNAQDENLPCRTRMMRASVERIINHL